MKAWVALILFCAVSTSVQADILSPPKSKILVVLSSENKITLKDGIVHPTGFFMSELAVPLEALIKAGYRPVFATPKGNAPAMDAISDSAMWFGGDENRWKEIRKFVAELTGLKNPAVLADIANQGLNQFAGIFVPGGHAPMEDLYRDPQLGRLLREAHASGLPTGLICHGPIALLSAGLSGEWPYKGYNMTVFSTPEEQQEEPGQDNALGGFVQFYPETALGAAGAKVAVAGKWQSHVIRDRELVTAQNPMSDKEFARIFLDLLQSRR